MRTAHTTLLTAMILGGLLVGVLPAAAADDIVISGGGWGHGIGMPQYGAKALAESGETAEDILRYFYEGVLLGTVGEGELDGHAEPLRIGVGQDLSQTLFSATGGALTVCLGAECHTAISPENWELVSDGLGSCQLHKNSAPIESTAACEGEITWGDQPNTRVSFPSLNRTYARGKIIFTTAPENTFHVVVELPLEEYLYGLGEMPSSWPEEALQAQAIAGRTYALYKAWVYRNLFSSQTRMDACACHLYASTFDQSYIGWAKEAEGTGGSWGAIWRAAVDNTAAQAMYHNSDGVSRAIEAYYFSSSGGATENNEDRWGGSPYPYLRSKPDPGSTFWEKVFSSTTFAALLGFDSVAWVEITATYASGSPKTIMVQGELAGSPLQKTYTGSQFKSALGLRSHYVISITGFLPPGGDQPVLHDPTTGKWLYRSSNGDVSSIFFGNPGDFGFFGDWDCDGVATPGLYRRSDGYVYLRNSNTQGVADVSYFFGNPGDLPLAGDFDGDGCDTVSIYRPSEGRFYVINNLGSGDGGLGEADYSFLYGVPGDNPFVGDWNGDGIDTPGLRRSSNGFVYLRNSNSQGVADVEFFYGDNGDIVFAGDWDGDGDDTIGLYRPSNGTIYLRNTNTTGTANFSYKMGAAVHRAVAG